MRKRFSLLYPDGEETDSIHLEEQVIKDLELENLITFMLPGKLLTKLQHECLRTIILNPSMDERTIQYRLDITADLLKYDKLFAACERLLPIIETLGYYRAARFNGQSPLLALVFRLGELESYIGCIDTLKAAFDTLDPASLVKQPLSGGLRELYVHILDIYANEDFLHLRRNLPELAGKIREYRSITVGVNLDNDFRPVSASLMSINKEYIDGKSTGFFNMMFKNDTGDLTGLASLHSRDNPHLAALFNDLSDVLKKICDPIQKALNRYITINTSLFTDIYDDLFFYISGVGLLLKIMACGMPVCKPELAPADERLTIIEENFNINLFIGMYKNGKHMENLITNRVNMGPEGRIIVLTGPNQGGKTVYTQGIGLSQVLFQAGLCIPGCHAVMSPVDNIFTHFQIEEQIGRERGRFADEAKRLHDYITKTTARTLILMNESFASTHYKESLYIAGDILKIFRILGIRAVFTTHLHDLAMQVDEINNETPGRSRLISLVSIVREEDADVVKRTYKIVPGPPAGKSYAREIAIKYGIGFEQLMELIREQVLCPD